MLEKTVGRALQPEIVFQLLVDIDQRWRWPDAGLHTETQAVGLARSVIGVLPQDNDAHLIKWSEVKRAKIFLAFGVNLFSGSFLLQQKFPQDGHIVAGKFPSERFLPAVVEFYAIIHILLIARRN